MNSNLIAKFAAEVVEQGRAEIDTARSKFKGKPDAFRRWGAQQVASMRKQLTIDRLLAWQSQHQAELQPLLSAESEAAVRTFDSAICEAHAAIDKQRREEEAKKNPPVNEDGLRRPPTSLELYNAHVRGRLNSLPESYPGKAPSRGIRRTMRRVGPL